MATIVADARERHGAIPHLDSALAENNKHYQLMSQAQGGGEIKFIEDTLTTGDYTILLDTRTGKKKIGMVLERKTWKDLASSIKDGRAKSQHKNLEEIREKTGCLVAYIIEGNLVYNDTTQIGHMPFKNLHSKLRHTMLRGTPFIQTKDEKHTAKMIVDLARDILKLYRTNVLFKPVVGGKVDEKVDNKVESKETQKDLLNEYCEAIRAVNKQYLERFKAANKPDDVIQAVQKIVSDDQDILLDPEAVDVSKVVEETIATAEGDIETLINMKLIKGDNGVPSELKTRKIMEDCDILENMWMAIPNVSDKSAPVIMQKYSLSDILAAPSDRIVFIQNDLAELKYSSGFKLGDKRAHKIMEIAYVGNDPIKKDHLRSLCVKVLAQIPNVTDDTARAILEKYTLREICLGHVNADDIAEIKKGKNKTRAIGEKIAEKICNLLQTKNTSSG